MPQFDTVVYLTIFLNFLLFSLIFYSIISLFFVPFFWNTYYYRYLKGENNFLFYYIFFENIDKYKNSILNYNNKIDLVTKSLDNLKNVYIKILILRKFFKLLTLLKYKIK